MQNLSKVIGGVYTTPNRAEEPHTASGGRSSTFATAANALENFDRPMFKGDGLDTDSETGAEKNWRSPERTRPTSEEKKINRPTTVHFFTLDQEIKR